MPVAPRIHRNAAYKPRKAWDKPQDKRKLTGRPWRRLREQIMERDGWMCQCDKCKGMKLVAHEVDHVIPVSAGGNDTPYNLRAMNRDCHKAKTKAESGSDAPAWHSEK